MASRNNRQSGRVVALAPTAARLGRNVRRTIYKYMGTAARGAVKAVHVVVRGTRNMQEASKHVTRFAADTSRESKARDKDSRS